MIFVWLAVVASRGFMGVREQAVFRAVYGMSTDWRPFALAVTQLGSPWLLGLLVVWLFARKQRMVGLALLWRGVIAFVACELTKLVVGRPRPMRFLADISSRDLFVFGAGFPSAHTAIATAVSMELARHLPKRWRYAVPVVWIAAVGWSRMYLGVHSPLDVLGGVMLGLGVWQAMAFGAQKVVDNKLQRPRGKRKLHMEV